jgi:uncharacterized protein (TIGR02145 family)
MKNKFYTPVLSGLILLFSLTLSCKKDEPAPVPPALTVTDADGNVYQTVKIGNQTWTTENLRTTKFNDGTSIPNETNGVTWTTLYTPAYCWYLNDITNKVKYGALYNRAAAHNPMLAPDGWHVSTLSDWDNLVNYLGAAGGGKLKQTGTINWNAPNTGATNETGFNAVPSGYRDDVGTFYNLKMRAIFWGITDNVIGEPSNNISPMLYYDQTLVNTSSTFTSETSGLSVRLVKD